MTICIPTIEENGISSRVSQHFGRAPFHMVVDVETMEVTALRKDGGCDDTGHGHCLPVRHLVANGVDLVACKEIGRGAFARLGASNIGVLEAGADTVEGVLKRYQQHRSEMGSPRICAGHHHP